MDTNTEILIRSIAHQCRQWCEDRDQLEAYPSETLCGWCAIAAAHLWRELRRKGIDSVICVAELTHYSHCYILCEDHIVDITATQFQNFRNSPILILHEREAVVYEFYNTTHTFKDARELRKWQRQGRWPSCQICYEEYM